MLKKDIGQVKLFWDYCKIWGKKVHSNLLPESNLPATEISSMNHLWDLMGVEKITNRIVRKVIEKIFVTKKRGNKIYLLNDKEAYIVATSEIDGAHGIPRGMQKFTDELQQVLHDVGGRSIGNGIKPSSAQIYSRRFVQRVNRNEEVLEGQKRRTRTGMIKLLGLSHKRAKKIYPRLNWLIFHEIYCMYSDTKNKEEINSAMILTSMSEHEEAKKVNK